jgi:hypothetical protein
LFLGAANTGDGTSEERTGDARVATPHLVTQELVTQELVTQELATQEPATQKRLKARIPPRLDISGVDRRAAEARTGFCQGLHKAVFLS